jgi:hypothetical protein
LRAEALSVPFPEKSVTNIMLSFAGVLGDWHGFLSAPTATHEAKKYPALSSGFRLSWHGFAKS